MELERLEYKIVMNDGPDMEALSDLAICLNEAAAGDAAEVRLS